MHYRKQGCWQSPLQQGHCNGQQLEKDFLSWACKQLVLCTLYFSIWETQVWDRDYKSNLKSNLTEFYALQQSSFKGRLGESACSQPFGGIHYKKKAIKNTNPSLSFCRHSLKQIHTKPQRGGKCVCPQLKKHMLRAICTVKRWMNQNNVAGPKTKFSRI